MKVLLTNPGTIGLVYTDVVQRVGKPLSAGILGAALYVVLYAIMLVVNQWIMKI